MDHVLDPRRASASGGTSGAYQSALVLTILFAVYATVSMLAEPIIGMAEMRSNTTREEPPPEATFANPLCRQSWEYRSERLVVLLGLTRREAEFGRRMLFSLALGALIGLERREANRGAGVRTMSLVSLGACTFCIGSVYAFEDGTQAWDASRVSAALPSGVGFLGGALIFKDNGQIKGLTTACGLWLSCAVGMCCGGGQYFVAGFGVMSLVVMSRFGPRSVFVDESEEPAEEKAVAQPPKKGPMSVPLLGHASTVSEISEAPSGLIQRVGSKINQPAALLVHDE